MYERVRLVLMRAHMSVCVWCEIGLSSATHTFQKPQVCLIFTESLSSRGMFASECEYVCLCGFVANVCDWMRV